MADWFQIALVVPPEHVENISAQLFELGCGGIQEDVQEHGTGLIAYFEDLNRQEGIVQACADILQTYAIGSEVRAALVPNEDWTTSWRDYFKPVYATAKILICPPWIQEPAPDGGFVILIDPKMAFGTGHHETTRLALAGLEMCMQGGEKVLDVGTGSGILSIAAMKLGADSVFAVDNDPPAAENTRENLVLNHVLTGVEVVEGTMADVVDIYDVSVANIISSILLPMIPDIVAHTRAGGHLILGGILQKEREDFCQSILNAGLNIAHLLEDGEWVCAVCSTPTS